MYSYLSIHLSQSIHIYLSIYLFSDSVYFSCIGPVLFLFLFYFPPFKLFNFFFLYLPGLFLEVFAVTTSSPPLKRRKSNKPATTTKISPSSYSNVVN